MGGRCRLSGGVPCQPNWHGWQVGLLRPVLPQPLALGRRGCTSSGLGFGGMVRPCIALVRAGEAQHLATGLGGPMRQTDAVDGAQ